MNRFISFEEMERRTIEGMVPSHYTVTIGKNNRSFHCKSSDGWSVVGDKEDTEMWDWFMRTLDHTFPHRLQEVYHNTCYLHKDFIVYLREQSTNGICPKGVICA